MRLLSGAHMLASRWIKEAFTVEVLSVAMAAKNSRDIAILPVESIVENGAIDPKRVKIPEIFVDYVVVAEKPEDHMQTFLEVYNPSFVKIIIILKFLLHRSLSMNERLSHGAVLCFLTVPCPISIME